MNVHWEGSDLESWQSFEPGDSGNQGPKPEPEKTLLARRTFHSSVIDIKTAKQMDQTDFTAREKPKGS